MMYTTLVKVKAHLRIDHAAEDFLLTSYIASASASVKNYLKSASPFQVELDDDHNQKKDVEGKPIYALDVDGNKIIDTTVEQATLLLVGYFYRHRDNDEKNEYEQGCLPKPITALLYPLRDPACK